jgi:hypothetical protein
MLLSAEAIMAEPIPCDECHFAMRCARQRLACEAWSMYAAGESEPRWRQAPRAPTRARWEATQ